MGTVTRSFGAGGREEHDSSAFYERALAPISETKDRQTSRAPQLDEVFCQSSEDMTQLPDGCVALMVTSPPYHVGKDYDSDATFEEYLHLLETVFAETHRVLQPGGRAVVNVANLGRRPYIPLSHLVTERMLKIGYFMRGEIIWQKGKGANGSCAWGSWLSAANPVFRDIHEYCLCFSKGRFDRVPKGESDISRDEFMAATKSIWEIPPESARRVGHPAPFPAKLAERFIKLYTFKDELVLDPFMGSGSTAVAAVQSGRKWVGYDTNADYCKLTRHRVRKATESGKAEALP